MPSSTESRGGSSERPPVSVTATPQPGSCGSRARGVPSPRAAAAGRSLGLGIRSAERLSCCSSSSRRAGKERGRRCEVTVPRGGSGGGGSALPFVGFLLSTRSHPLPGGRVRAASAPAPPRPGVGEPGDPGRLAWRAGPVRSRPRAAQPGPRAQFETPGDPRAQTRRPPGRPRRDGRL